MLDASRDHPLTQSQLRFWHGTRLAPSEPIYTMVWRFDLMQAIDPTRFSKALEGVVRETEALHVAFRDMPDGPRQFANPDHFSMPPVLDLSVEHDAEAALQNWLRDWAREPFDLGQSTYRARLVKLTSDHWVWLSAQHHISCDAQSGALLFAAVSNAYEAADMDTPKSYFEAAEQLNALYLMRDDSTEGHFEDGTSCGRPYGASITGVPESTRVPVSLSTGELEALERLIEDPAFSLLTPDLTRFAVYSAVYASFLSRVSSSQNITLGLPSHNRLDGASRVTQGLFVEVLPLSIDVAEEDSFRTVFGKLRTALGQFLRQAKPNAIAQVASSNASGVLNFIQAKFGDFASGPAKVTWIHSGAHDPQHPLRLHVTDFDGCGSKFAMDVAASVSERVDPQQVAHQFAAILAGCAADPDRGIATLPLCAPDDATAARLTGPKEHSGVDQSVLAMIAAQVKKTPDATAVQHADHSISYAEMWNRAGNIAAEIQSRGLPPGPIALHMTRSVDAVLALLGALRAGRSFVPIARNTPIKRTADILTMSKSVAIFCDDERKPDLAESGLPCLDTKTSAPKALDAPRNDTAYVIFTSGSTGTPKGVVVTQSGLARYIRWAAKSFGGDGSADYALFSSLSFDLTITSIFAPLVSGGAIHVYPETGPQDLAVLDVFRDDRAQVVKLTPSHLALVCEMGHQVNTIRTLVLGGENLTTRLCRQAHSSLGRHIDIINEYGPTEAVVGAMIHHFDPARDRGGSVPIGRPADGVEISVRDVGMNVLPAGVEGEICISGRLADGYLDRPDMTKARFVTAPTGERIYTTGDIGCLNKDGIFEYFGRADSQLKVGGVRVETAEFEGALNTVPGVHAVHVLKGKPARSGQCCTRCGLKDDYPGATFGDDGLCSICAGFEDYKDRAQAYFRTEPELVEKLADARKKSRGAYDAVMLLSGGKDSTYAAYRLAALTNKVLAVTLDNGFISEGAKENIARVTTDLGWDHRYLTTSKMNEIFVDSLYRHSNVCQGCFKAVYTLAIRTARAEGAPMIVTGLSRGQFFETRLTPELFAQNAPTCAELEHMVNEARRRYHDEDDAVARLLETSDLADGQFLEEIEILDIYRFIDVPVSEIYSFLIARGAWQRPKDTGRSTNCLINDAGIQVHKTREGFHNYALPYSWDVRMGHKTRDEALDELNDQIDSDNVNRILTQIGYVAPSTSQNDELIVYVAADKGISQEALRSALRANLPAEVQPSHIICIDRMPLTSNGKVDPTRLPAPTKTADAASSDTPPKTKTELRLAEILCKVLACDFVGRDTDFFDLGLDSLAAIQVAMRATEINLPLPVTALFDYRTLRELADFADGLEPEASAPNTDDAFDLGLDDDDFAAIANALN